ncbi:MAG: sulfatase-like hydrolase/transferase, partial [Planctomycetales bacterium]|nr:sulfatase-like hydrolase/transferase [Planctomycetales bacterium]
MLATAAPLPATAAERPNFIIILTDDQGYQDLGVFGSPHIQTPHIDHMAQEGRIFTSFYVANPLCSASRAALMTGCYPKRLGMKKTVFFPQDRVGLHPEEVTIADMLQDAGYATACIGKWHLGHRQPFLPTRQGFDSYWGIPYSNDMTHPDNKQRPPYGKWDEGWRNREDTFRW